MDTNRKSLSGIPIYNQPMLVMSSPVQSPPDRPNFPNTKTTVKTNPFDKPSNKTKDPKTKKISKPVK